jgi:hypothetical protein
MLSPAHRRSATKSTRRARTSPQHVSGASPRQIPATALVAMLRARGVKLKVVGDQLEVVAPRGTLTDVDQERLWHSLERVCALLISESQSRIA